MFIRRKKAGEDRTKVQIVKSVRTGDKVRQRVLRHVGTAHGEEELERLEGVAEFILEELKAEDSGTAPLFTPKELADLTLRSRRAAENPEPFGVDVSECRHGGRVDAGIREVFGGVYASMGWDRLFGARRMSANRIIKELTLARLAQ
ncbi:MAG: hypothetical protein OXF74_11495, partial [Rhodobacteraceae bacterium]|nr:hypothetical protein [Paracoccaceae bacterium]